MNPVILITAIVVVVAIAVTGSIFLPENIVQIFGFSSVVIGFFVTFLQAKQAAVKVEAVAVKVEEVAIKAQESATKTEEQLTDLAIVAVETKKTGEAIHVLVNSSMLAALKTAMVALRRVADITKGTPEGAADEAAAKVAEEGYYEHERKQKLLDASPNKDAK